MIIFEMICAEKHRFEGWFGSSDDFEHQKSRGMLSCPTCGSMDVEKLLTAKIGRQETVYPKPGPVADGQRAGRQITLAEIIDHVLLTTEDVGTQFAAEARRIHAKQAPIRGIRGQATAEESQALADEGIEVLSLPIPDKSSWN